jgi:hypothetical protein
LGLNKGQGLLGKGLNKVEKELIEFLRRVRLEVGVNVQDVFLFRVYFGAVVVGFVDQLRGDLKDFRIDF